jgi:hypothetical protein
MSAKQKKKILMNTSSLFFTIFAAGETVGETYPLGGRSKRGKRLPQVLVFLTSLKEFVSSSIARLSGSAGAAGGGGSGSKYQKLY